MRLLLGRNNYGISTNETAWRESFTWISSIRVVFKAEEKNALKYIHRINIKSILLYHSKGFHLR